MTSVRKETGSAIDAEEVRSELERRLVAALKMEKIKKYTDENTFLKDFNVQLSGTVP